MSLRRAALSTVVVAVFGYTAVRGLSRGDPLDVGVSLLAGAVMLYSVWFVKTLTGRRAWVARGIGALAALVVVVTYFMYPQGPPAEAPSAQQAIQGEASPSRFSRAPQVPSRKVGVAPLPQDKPPQEAGAVTAQTAQLAAGTSAPDVSPPASEGAPDGLDDAAQLEARVDAAIAVLVAGVELGPLLDADKARMAAAVESDAFRAIVRKDLHGGSPPALGSGDAFLQFFASNGVPELAGLTEAGLRAKAEALLK